jgi:hypothetical protein
MPIKNKLTDAEQSRLIAEANVARNYRLIKSFAPQGHRQESAGLKTRAATGWKNAFPFPGPRPRRAEAQRALTMPASTIN